MMIKSAYHHLSFFFCLALLCGMSLPLVTTTVIPCREAERQALLDLKHRLDDPSNRLSSWVGKDCCAWQGVGCSNITAHVTKLNLRNEHYNYIHKYYYYKYGYNNDRDVFALRGDISSASSLQSLQHLAHLDLSGNDFSGHTIPAFFGSFARLTYLNLSYTSFTGKVPEQLGNLSALRLLDISNNYYLTGDIYDERPHNLYVENPGWIARLTALRHLNMSEVKLGSVSTLFEALNSLPHIQDIELALCDLAGPLPRSPSHLNFTSLLTLNLAGNYINGTEPEWLYNITTMETLDFGWNDISWSFMHGSMSRLTSLRRLDLSRNLISKNFLLSLSNLCQLQILSLEAVLIEIEMPNLEMVFSGCLMYSLEELHLQGNNLSDSFLIWLGNMKNLKHMDLSHNLLNGSLPVPLGSITSLQYLDLSFNKLTEIAGEIIGQLKSLVYLDLSYNSLSLSIIHLVNLSSLKYLDIRNNSFFINDTDDWMPSFQLESLNMDSCKILGRPHFPNWLQTQVTLSSLSLTNARIEGTIPNWFPSSLQYLNLSNNKIGGELTHFFSNLTILDLANNSLSGHLPLQMGNMMPNLESLDLSNNNLFGEMPQNFTKLRILDLSNNLFSGHIPLQLENMIPNLENLYLFNNNFTGMVPQNFTELRVLDLSNNLFSGHLPIRMANMMPTLESLDLSNNYFTGEMPQNFTKLKALDLSNNLFSGNLYPIINNTLSNLEYLKLSMNKFTGSIPHSLCQLNLLRLQVSNNYFSGELPNCWSSTSSVTIVDFSNNQFYGEIPNTFCNLRRIRSLYASYNQLSGRIPICLQDCKYLTILDIGHNYLVGNMPSWSNKSLSYLEVLNLRSNYLSGIIPELSKLTRLQILDLSNNNLSGSIPQTFGNFTEMRNSSGNTATIIFALYYSPLWLFIKGNEHEYKRSYTLTTSIDLSNNALSGYIPKELGSLHRLQNLNLSRNNLIGEIPTSIGGMQKLEVLDLSRNNLSGAIPSTLRDLTFLGILNLSYNNLSGNIPTGAQLQTFDTSTYIGNPYLCGSPLLKNCTNDMAKSSEEEESKDDNRRETIWLSSSITMGFILGFWGIWGILLLQKRWRIYYFRIVDNTNDKLCMKVSAKIRRKH